MASEAVKAFISYGWSTPEHEEWVLALATRLREDGVDVIIDQWDLKPGHDAYKFMEQMVSDESVKRVILVCDRRYSEKADKRVGGVGTESQIISPELYGNSRQDKFAAIVREYQDDGSPAVPVFYKGRIHFDFVEPDQFEPKYEELLRWLLGRPSKVKPPLGKVPAHIQNGSVTPSLVTSRHRRANEALRQGSNSALGLLQEYCEEFVRSFEAFRVSDVENIEYDDQILQSIERAQVEVAQFVSTVSAVIRFTEGRRAFGVILATLEGLARYMFRGDQVGSFTDWDFDNFKFLCSQIFLNIVAITLYEQRFDLAQELVERRFLVDGSETGGRTLTYELFWNEIKSLKFRNERLNLGRRSLQADLLKKFQENGSPNFKNIMEADFFLWMRSQILQSDGKDAPFWYPITEGYMSNRWEPFPLFARMESKSYFMKVRHLLGDKNPADYSAIVTKVASNVRAMLPFRGGINRLANGEHVGSLD